VSQLSDQLIQVNNLEKNFVSAGKTIRALDDVSLTVEKGKKLGLVGESGCGKSTLGRCILRLLEPDSGEIYFEGKNILKLHRHEMRQLRQRMQIIFQDPFSSLNPRMTIRQILERPLVIHHMYQSEKEKRVVEILELVNIPQKDMDKFPHEFSGGQRQRIALARAIITNPDFVLLDEPTSSLDVSVQAGILNLLNSLMKRLGTTYIFISHDLAVVSQMCDFVNVMYLGKIVESAPTQELFQNPLHPYTKMLLSALLVPGLKIEKVEVSGEPPGLFSLQKGCGFCSRCQNTDKACKEETPTLIEVTREHKVMCKLYR
jgi:peptide/nickel transport system ATP-binding protein